MAIFGLVTQSELDKRLQSFTTKQGLKGDRGDVGPKGEQGPRGIPGPMGEQGLQGPKGDPGQKGDKGDSGSSTGQVQVIYASPSKMEGLRAGGPDNSFFLQNAIDSWPAKGTIYLPDGDFHFTKELLITNKPIRLIGTGATRLIFENCNGIIVGNKTKVVLKDFDIISRGGAIGLFVCSISQVENINIFYPTKYGVWAHAAIEEGNNCSHSMFTNVEVIECKGDAFYIQGPDANAIGFYNCSARDSEGWGFWDSSFLGCRFVNCMGHANKKGHYMASDPNNRAVFMGCYSESQGTKNVASGHARVVGGIHPDGWEVGPYAKVDAD